MTKNVGYLMEVGNNEQVCKVSPQVTVIRDKCDRSIFFAFLKMADVVTNIYEF